MSRTITLTVAMPQKVSPAAHKVNPTPSQASSAVKGHETHTQGEKSEVKAVSSINSLRSTQLHITRSSVVVPSVIGIHDSPFHFSVFCQWPEKGHELEFAPEISLLTKRPCFHFFGKDTSFLLRILEFFGTLCKSRVHPTYGLANFKPLDARTNHTHDYVDHIVQSYTVPPTPKESTAAFQPDTIFTGTSPSVTTTGTQLFNKIFNPKEELLKEFYKAAHLTLQHLQNGITLYKQIILTLSFTRYAEKELTLSEIKLTAGKSVIGSCMWVITYALQQLQAEPELKSMSRLKTHPILAELAKEIQTVCTLSYHAWAETVTAIGVVERIHKTTETLFLKQTTNFHVIAKPDSEDAIFTSVHLKKYRRNEVDSSQLRKFEAPHAVPTLGAKKYGFPRIIYDNNYATKEGPIWKGFDPLSVKDKVFYLRNVLKFVKLTLESVMDSARRIVLELQGPPGRRSHNRPPDYNSTESTRHAPSRQFTIHDIKCYEDGLYVMDEILSKKLTSIDWSRKQIEEFFEIDKIFLDDMDCLTMGAGLTRSILHDARRTIHLCYETSKLTDFFDFHNLPEYLKLLKKLKEESVTVFQPPSVSKKSAAPGARTKTLVRKDSIHNPYDIEELSLDIKNIRIIFRSSPYFEITKTLPVYCCQVGITVQEADLVFTPSSEKLLSKLKPLETAM